jgi:hypothetical protein
MTFDDLCSGKSKPDLAFQSPTAASPRPSRQCKRAGQVATFCRQALRGLVHAG